MSTADSLKFQDIIEINDRFHDSALLHFAASIDLFDRLTRPQSAAELAGSFGWIERKARVMLDALTALGLLVKEHDRYRNAQAAEALLRRDAPGSLLPVIEHQRLQWDLWSRIGEVLAAEGSIPAQQELRLKKDAIANATYNQAMRNLSVGNINAFLELDVIKGPKHVLDLAGGHGEYATRLAQRNPGLTAEIWDLPTAAGLAEETVAAHGVAGRVVFKARDIGELASYEGATADAVLLNNCLHYFDAPKAEAIVARVTEIVPRGGQVVITAVTLQQDRTAPTAAACFSFHMVMNAGPAELHATSWLLDVLRRQDLAVETHELGSLGVMGVTVMIGTKR